MAEQFRSSHHPALPRLKETSRVKNFSEAGKWDVREASELEVLSESLNVERVDFDINSIPDMWARPLLFEMALYDPEHLAHKRTLGEWRGLLALLALKEVLGFSDLSVMRVKIEQAGGGPRPNNQTSPFLDALSKLAPKMTLADDTLWNDLYVILFKNGAIGMTSPTTLVCTATRYYDRIHNVPWMNGSFLTDPTPHLAADHKKKLAAWLNILKTNLNQHSDLDQSSKRWGALLGIIGDFVDDLDGASETATELNDIGFGMQSGIFLHLDNPVKGDEPVPERSHVRLLPSRENAPSKTILVADHSIAGQWRKHEHDILVWGGIPLDTAIPFSGLSGRATRIGNRELRDAEIWPPSEFFTEKLFVVKLQDAFPGAMRMNIHGGDYLRYQPQGDMVTPILPVNKTLLEYLNSEDLSKRIIFEQINDGILVRLRLRLSGEDGAGKEFTISREYRFSNNEVILIRNVPVLEIWPNFKTRNSSWKAYYTYFSPALETDVFYADPYTPGAEKVVETFTDSRGEIRRRVTRSTQFPEAMICDAPVANPESNMMELNSAGVILINQPNPLPTQAKTLKIGIDFGATNTNIYAREGENDPFAVIFNDRFLRVTASGFRRAQLYDDFLPGDDEKTPFQSLFHDFLQAPNSQELRPLLDGHIYFLQDYKGFDASGTGMATDLKWSDRSEDRIRARSFLEQLCLQTAAEAVALGAEKVMWSYSFPTSFSDKARIGFPEIWEQIAVSCSSLTGLSQTGALIAKTESVASALFFWKRHTAPIASGTVCIDIGGSTSDIAVWQNDELIWQTSLRLAGRDMFLKLLYAAPSFLEVFGADVSQLKQKKGQLTAFYAQADALISREGHRWFERLPNHARMPEVQRLIQLIAVGLSGIFYYIGLTLQHLVAAEKYSKMIPDVYVGGNAARLLHWLAAGSYNRNSAINELFKRALLQASGFEGKSADFRVTISHEPKGEAAYGLVCHRELGLDVDIEEGVLAGERFIEAGEERGWHEMLTPDKLKGGLVLPASLEQFNNFIEVFNKYATSKDAVVPPISDIEATMRDVRKRLEGSLSELTRHDPAAILVEPIFILALKHLLDIKAEEWNSNAAGA
jgi:hypothetical protein